jgi:lysophospholipase L1-like esterase
VRLLDYHDAIQKNDSEILTFSDNRYLGWELRPSVHRHNSQGMRAREYPFQKSPHTRRITVLGDSVTYGSRVPFGEDYPSVLERKLKKLDIEPVEVLNFGVPGYSTFQEYMILRSKVLRFSPDLVIMTFTPDDVETSPVVVINVNGHHCLFSNHFERTWLLNNDVHWTIFRLSHFYRLLYKKAVLAFAKYTPGENFNDKHTDLKASQQNVLRVYNLCRRNGIGFMLVMSPFLRPFVHDPVTFERQMEIFRHLREFADGRFDVLDLNPIYEKHGKALKCAREDHEHPNSQGHELIANAIYDRLISGRESHASVIRPMKSNE